MSVPGWLVAVWLGRTIAARRPEQQNGALIMQTPRPATAAAHSWSAKPPRHEGKPLYEAIVLKGARHEAGRGPPCCGPAWATAIRRHVHSAKILQLSDGLAAADRDH